MPPAVCHKAARLATSCNPPLSSLCCNPTLGLLDEGCSCKEMLRLICLTPRHPACQTKNTSSCWQPQLAAVHAVQGQCGRGVCSLRLLAERCALGQQRSSSTLPGSVDSQQCGLRQQPQRQPQAAQHPAGLPRGCERQQFQRQCSSSLWSAWTAVDGVLAGHGGEHCSTTCQGSASALGLPADAATQQLRPRTCRPPVLQQKLSLPHAPISGSLPLPGIDTGKHLACRQAALLLVWKLSQLRTTASMQ